MKTLEPLLYNALKTGEGRNPLSISNAGYFIFFTFFIIYTIIGIIVIYPGDAVYEYFDFIYGIDCPRIFDFLTALDTHSYNIHTLFPIQFQPVTFLINSIVNNMRISVIVLQAVLASSINSILFLFLKNIVKKDIKISLLLTAIYGFSFAMILFTGVPESYIYSAFFFTCLIYYILYLINSKTKSLSSANIFILTFLGVSVAGISTSNFVGFIFGILFLINKIYPKQFKTQLKTFLKFTAIFIILSVIISSFERVAYPKSTALLGSIGTVFSGHAGQTKYLNFDFGIKNIFNTIAQTYIYPIIALPYHLTKYKVVFYNYEILKSSKLLQFHFAPENNIFTIVLSSIFYLIPIGLYIKNFKKQKENIVYIKFLAIYILINFFMSAVYDSKECFMYSLNSLFSVFMLLGCIIPNSNKISKFLYLFYSGFLIYQACINCHYLFKFAKYLGIHSHNLCNRGILWIYSIIAAAIIVFIIFILKKLISKDLLKYSEKNLVFWITVYLTYIILFSIMLSLKNLGGI